MSQGQWVWSKCTVVGPDGTPVTTIQALLDAYPSVSLGLLQTTMMHMSNPVSGHTRVYTSVHNTGGTFVPLDSLRRSLRESKLAEQVAFACYDSQWRPGAGNSTGKTLAGEGAGPGAGAGRRRCAAVGAELAPGAPAGEPSGAGRVIQLISTEDQRGYEVWKAANQSAESDSELEPLRFCVHGNALPDTVFAEYPKCACECRVHHHTGLYDTAFGRASTTVVQAPAQSPHRAYCSGQRAQPMPTPDRASRCVRADIIAPDGTTISTVKQLLAAYPDTLFGVLETSYVVVPAWPDTPDIPDTAHVFTKSSTSLGGAFVNLKLARAACANRPDLLDCEVRCVDLRLVPQSSASSDEATSVPARQVTLRPTHQSCGYDTLVGLDAVGVPPVPLCFCEHGAAMATSCVKCTAQSEKDVAPRLLVDA